LAPAITGLLTAFPRELVIAIAGLALLGTIGSGLATALQDEQHREAALITFLVTLSGVSIAGVGSAFWGVLAGALALVCGTVRSHHESADAASPSRGRHLRPGKAGSAVAPRKTPSQRPDEHSFCRRPSRSFPDLQGHHVLDDARGAAPRPPHRGLRVRSHLVWSSGDKVKRARCARSHSRADADRWFGETSNTGTCRWHEFGAVLMRKDPPFDSEYFYATHLLEQAEREGAKVFNKPRSLRDHPEKAGR
jgi:hypothetical protein